MSELGEFLDDPKGCDHHWQAVSMVFETQWLDERGGVVVRQPSLDGGRVYLVCLRCAQHTYMTTNWAGFRLEGTEDRGFGYNPSSSHPYTVVEGSPQRERPDPVSPHQAEQ